MESSLKPSLLLFLILLTLVGFGVMAFLVNGDQIIRFDRAIISFAQGLENPVLTSIMKFFTFLGSGESIKVLAFVTAIILFFFLKHRSELLLFLVVLVGSPIIWRSLKELFQRARPDLHRLIEIGGYSFPSGHATNAMTLYGILTFLLWRHIPTRSGRTVLLVLSSIIIFLIGFSRIYLGVHYPSDVIAGYMIGGFWLALAIWVYQFIKEKLYSRRRQKD